MSNDMFETKIAIRFNDDTWIIPEGYKIVKLSEPGNLMERVKNVCKAHMTCSSCPFRKGEGGCLITAMPPDMWDIDEIWRRLEEAGR